MASYRARGGHLRGDALRIAAFNAVSIITTTGYALVDYNQWGGFAVGAFFFMTFVGACAGSTAGGIKIFRFQIADRASSSNWRVLFCKSSWES